MLIRPSNVRKIGGRKRMTDEVSLSVSQIGRIGSHAVLQQRGEWQYVVRYLDRVGGILREVLGLRHHDGRNFPLKIQFSRQWFGQYPAPSNVGGLQFRRILVGKNVFHARHFLRGRRVDVLDVGVRVRTGEEPRVEQVGEPNAAGVLRFAGEPRNGNFGQRRPWLP
jgi:hypothetical protein